MWLCIASRFNEFSKLLLAELKLNWGEVSAKQLVAQPNSVSIDNIRLAIMPTNSLPLLACPASAFKCKADIALTCLNVAQGYGFWFWNTGES